MIETSTFQFKAKSILLTTRIFRADYLILHNSYLRPWSLLSGICSYLEILQARLSGSEEVMRSFWCPVVYSCHGRWASLSASELPISLWADNDPATTTCLPYVFRTCHVTRNCIWHADHWQFDATGWSLLYFTAAPQLEKSGRGL